MAAPVFQLADFGNSASGTITRQKDIGVTLRVDVDDVSFDYGTGGGWDRTAIVWYWDDAFAPEWKYNVHLGGWVSGHSWDTVGTKTMWCALVNGDSRFSVVTAVNTGGDVAGAVDAAVTAGEATKVTRTIDVIDTLTEIYYDYVNGDDANDGSEASPKKTLPRNLDATFDNTRHIFVTDSIRNGTVDQGIRIEGTNIVLDLRNASSIIWPQTSPMIEFVGQTNCAIKRDSQTKSALIQENIGGGARSGVQSSGGGTGITLENVSTEGDINGYMFSLGSPDPGIKTGDILSYNLSAHDTVGTQSIWIGSGGTDSEGNNPGSGAPENDSHFVAFRPWAEYGSHFENGVRAGSANFVTIIDPKINQAFVPGRDLNWREDGNWLFGDGIAEVESVNRKYTVGIDSGTGVTTGWYIATEKGADPITGEPALKLLTSPSTSNVDLLNNDIQLKADGGKSPLRLSPGKHWWIRGFEHSSPISPIKHASTMAGHAPLSATGGDDEDLRADFVIIERCKGDPARLYGNSIGGGANKVLVRSCIVDHTATDTDGYTAGELAGTPEGLSIFAEGGNATRNNSDEIAFVNCTHLANSIYSNFFTTAGTTKVDIVNCLSVNPSLEVLDQVGAVPHYAVRAKTERVTDKVSGAKWDESTMQLHWGTDATTGDNFNNEYPPLTNPGVRIEITSGTGVTLGQYLIAEPSTHAGSGERALTLETSPSTSNIDLTSGDISYHIIDIGLWLFRSIKNNQFSPFAVDPGTGSQSGDKLFIVEDLNNDGFITTHDAEDVTAFNARPFASGNVMQLAALLSDYYPSSNIITAPPDTRCFEDYYGNPMDGSLEVVGAVSETTSAGPALTNATVETISDTSISATVTTDTASGTLYRYVSLSATAPSTSDHKAGTGSVAHDSNTVTATGQQTLSDFTGLTADTLYYVHFLQDDGAGNDSLTASDFTTTTSPSVIATLSNAVVTATSSDTLAFSVDTDTGSGDAYAYLSTSSTPPSEADLINGTGAVQHQTVSVGSTGTINFSDFTGLSAETTYWVHFIQVNDENSNIVTGSDTTPASGVGPSLTSPSASAIGQDTMTASCVSDTLGGTAYVYYSTSATPPSESDLINGTGSVAHETKVL